MLSIRFYLAQIHVINELKPNIVVFICDFDPFGEGLYQYTFENKCNENDMSLGDETKKIFFNIHGKNTGDTRTELINLLKYMKETTDECVGLLGDMTISRLHGYVTELKKDREWERCYMRVEDLIKSAERKALVQGRKDMQQELLDLVTKMIKSGEAEQVVRLSEDKAFFAEMRRKYLNADS